MEDNQPSDTIHKVSLVKKILLYVNVSTYKAFDTPNTWRRDSRSTDVFAIVFTEFTVLNFFYKYDDSAYYNGLLIALFFFHVIIYFALKDKIISMAANYYVYYNKAAYYISLFFWGIGILGLLIDLNNQIGHVTK
jgi:hypothetical protein